MATEQNDELITVREAAKECGRNMETVRRWIWGGKLPARKLGNQLFIRRSDLASYCRETAVRPYEAEGKQDFLEQAVLFREKLRARGVQPVNTAEEIRKMREDRMNQIRQSMKETAETVHRRESLLDFIKKARAVRSEICARTGKTFNAEAMIRELREEREHELE